MALAMRIRGGIDDPCRGARDETFHQSGRQHKVRHVIERKGALQTLVGNCTAGKHRSGIVDEHVDMRLGGGDLPRHALDFGNARQVRIMDGGRNPRRCGIEPCEQGLAALRVARNDDEPRAQFRQALGSDFADTGGRSGHHNDFAANGRQLCRSGAFTQDAPSIHFITENIFYPCVKRVTLMQGSISRRLPARS